MEIYQKTADIKTHLRELQKKGKSIGLVPTMGYLHEGHLSLIEFAKKENDVVVLSIFVNPAQFGPGEDFERYPRDLESDTKMAEQAGVNLVFLPEVLEMYPEGYQTYVEVENITKTLCGASRPGHFKGVTTVVSKLINIVDPDRTYFGQKDAQQSIVIKRMVKELNMDTTIRVCPIVREEDGLAKSSRNVYLNSEERKQAVILNKSLKMAQELIENGENNVLIINSVIQNTIKEMPLAIIDYVSVVNGETLDDIAEITGKVLIAVAVKFGRTRLIDNIMVEV